MHFLVFAGKRAAGALAAVGVLFGLLVREFLFCVQILNPRAEDSWGLRGRNRPPLGSRKTSGRHLSAGLLQLEEEVLPGPLRVVAKYCPLVIDVLEVVFQRK